LADFDLSLSEKEGFAKTIQFLSDREAQNWQEWKTVFLTE
jgi:hypothetical protein